MKKLFFLYIILSVQITLSAQQRTHIPYSIFGLGQLNPKGSVRNMAMGRSGIALASLRYLNNMNPASYYKIDSISFFFDFGLRSDFVKYSTRSEGTQKGNNANIQNIAIGFKFTPNWTASFGIAPFSTVGYKINTLGEVEGTSGEYYTVINTGEGGLNQFYWDNSYLLFKHLSLGVSFNYLFGKIQSTETVSPGIVQDYYLKEMSYMHKLFADFGMQYNFEVKKDFEITLGAVFGNSHGIRVKDEETFSTSGGTVIKENTLRRGTFDFPLYAGGGFAVSYKSSLTLTADYLYHDWSNTDSRDDNFYYKNTNTFRAGIEFIPGRFYNLGYFGGIAYRFGYYNEGSYLQFNNKKTFNDQGITAGLGLPFLQNRTSINLSYDYGMNGTLENDLIKENYHTIMLSVTLHDWWFIKRKID